MGFGGIGIWQLLIILVIIILLFGTKKLRNIGGDLGAALRNFRGAVKEGKEEGPAEDAAQLTQEGMEKKEAAAETKDKEKA